MTKTAGVIGNPVGHSRSPLIHGHWLKLHGIDGNYTKQDVAPEDLPAFLDTIRRGEGWVGCNVTIPHKQAVMDLVDELHPSAVAAGAANTIWLEGGKLHAMNTDGAGFVAHLDQSVPDWRKTDAQILVLGAGGAARGIIAALLGIGARRIIVVNRTFETAEKLATDFGDGVYAQPWKQIGDALNETRVLINTTSLGMTGQPPLVVDLASAARPMFVADIVYSPLETDLLKAAKAAGHTPIDGLGMLLHQAVQGFSRWFGVTPEVTPELRALVVADLEGR